MDRNTITPYGELDTIEVPRSVWNRSHTHKTTFNAGFMIPFYVNTDIIPGTTIKNTTSVVIRMSTPIRPIMDNLYLDTYYFKCSKFWYWDHFKEQMGENEHGTWTQSIEYTTPQITTTTAYSVNDVANYIGIPIGITGISYDRCAIYAYIDIYNNWFRDQNLQAPIQLDKSDADLEDDATINTGFGLLPVNKTHDYFTSLLPQPQKGPAITTPLGTRAPVMADHTKLTHISTRETGQTGDNTGINTWFNVGTGTSTTPIAHNTVATSDFLTGLYTDLTNATAATINALRLATQTQRILEKDARYGTRYRELLRGQWGVIASDESLMVPEYLGGKRIPINIETVLQQSQTSEQSPLGETGAFSVTADVNEDFTKSFTKHDILIGICCVRVGAHTYQQGIARQFKRDRRFDHYHTSLAHLGNQPVYNYEIFATGTPQDDQVFGFKEAWQEYLYTPNRISGELLSTYAQSLDTWHLGDDYATLPVLSDEWIKEPRENIDRVLAVSSDVSHQFIADFYIEQTVAAPIPLNRVPGLLDHY